MKTPRRFWSDADIDELTRLWEAGVHYPDLIVKLRRTKSSIATKVGILGLRRRDRRPVSRKLVPAWVPEALREEYRLVAAEQGEHAAAAWARREKRLAT